MYVLIDTKEMRMVAAAHKRSHMELIRLVDFADLDDCTCNANDGGSWTHFTREQMAQLYKNTSGLQEAPEYGEAIEQLRSYVLTWSDYPKSEEQLEDELRDMQGEDDIPNDDPIKQQIAANQAMRKAHQETIAIVEEANAREAHKPAAERAVKPAAEAKPKVTRSAPMQGVTKRVWEIADACYDPNVELKATRKKIMELAEQEGIHPGTAATQYGKWKAERGYA